MNCHYRKTWVTPKLGCEIRVLESTDSAQVEYDQLTGQLTVKVIDSNKVEMLTL